MSLRARLLLFGYPLLEIATAYLVALWIGWGWMLLLIIIGFPIGFAIMRNAGDAAMRDLQQAAATGTEPDSSRRVMTFLAGVLVFVPGFWTDLAGLLLLVPPIQRLFRQRSQTWVDARFTTMRMPGVHYPGAGYAANADVIQGTVIHTQDPEPPQPPPRAGGPAELT